MLNNKIVYCLFATFVLILSSCKSLPKDKINNDEYNYFFRIINQQIYNECVRKELGVYGERSCEECYKTKGKVVFPNFKINRNDTIFLYEKPTLITNYHAVLWKIHADDAYQINVETSAINIRKEPLAETLYIKQIIETWDKLLLVSFSAENKIKKTDYEPVVVTRVIIKNGKISDVDSIKL